MKLSRLITDLQNTRDYENLSEVLGKKLASKIKMLVKMSEHADKELYIVHNALTELYELDTARQIVRDCLEKIEKI